MRKEIKKLIKKFAKKLSIEEKTLSLLYECYCRYKIKHRFLKVLAKGLEIAVSSDKLRYLITKLHQEDKKRKQRNP